MSGIRWGYAINQWKPQFDDFVRREQHERALKTISIAGFEGVELTAGTGRWEPLGNPEQLAANFGSVGGFRDFLSGCAIDTVSSWFWDPQERSMEHLTGPLSPLVAEDTPAIVAKANWFAECLKQLGGSVLLVRAAPSAGDVDALDDDALQRLADCWSAVGAATLQHGVQTAVHVDFLSALRRDDALDRLLARTNPDLVGLAVDTGEFTVAGIDPCGVVQRHADRIRHVQFKDALAVDDEEEYLQPHAHWTVRVRGGSRGVPRWFAEPGAEDGLVDFPQITRALLRAGYFGWIVFESDQSSHPAASALLGGYLMQRELRPIIDRKGLLMATGDTVLTEDSLIRRPDGLGIALTVPWYRSLWLSSVSGISVAIEGKEIPNDQLRVQLREQTYRVDELQEQWDVLWFIQDRLVVIVPVDEQPADGAAVDVEVTVDLRLPYMQIAPMTYVTNHATNRRSLVAR